MTIVEVVFPLYASRNGNENASPASTGHVEIVMIFSLLS